jgi:superfamily II DNA or RNA helicase
VQLVHEQRPQDAPEPERESPPSAQDDAVESRLTLPPRRSQAIVVDGNTAWQVISSAESGVIEQGDGGWFARAPNGQRYELLQRGHTPPGRTALELPLDALRALPRLPAPEALRWVSSERASEPREVRESLLGAFTLRAEDAEAGTPGLRLPQAGALHAVLAHWSTGETEPATVVLPTGTGKTETMVALFASERLLRVLVLVPSDNLRTQIAETFETYGVLPAAGVLDARTVRPVVGPIEHGFASVAAMRSFVERCNVLVATPNALGASSDDVVAALAHRCSELFVDEAHHVPAKTWSRVRGLFSGKPVTQFTATPYREDGNRLGGRVVYSFPLRRARELGYFESIDYVSVVALSEADRAVAEHAIARLREDRAAGFDHLIMARVSRIGRAREQVAPIYRELAPELNPVVLHSGLPARERAAALEALRERRSRVVVCVDMLGEGFNLPELKIAALHDPHRSLGVALQFIGRFARSRSDLGRATAVVARPDPGYDERLRALYAERNQWDAVIENLSATAVEQVRELDEFEAGFAHPDEDELPVHVLRPKMSTVVYTTACRDWHPERLADLFAADDVLAGPVVNASERVAWAVVRTRAAVRWGLLHAVEDVAHHLHLLHWDRDRALLYINSSNLESLHEDLAHAVCGESAERITGEVVYRVLGDVRRPVPTNVGVIHLRNRSRRFSMHVGADVYEGFPVAEQQTKTNTNVFVIGFEEGERVTLGAARKGRIWSQLVADSIFEWVRWCRRLGPRLQDSSIELDALFRSFVRPRPLESRPNLMPLAIDWTWTAFAGMSESVQLEVNGNRAHLIDVDLALTEHREQGPIRFQVRGDGFDLPYEALVQEGGLAHRALETEARIVRERADPEPLSVYLDREGTLVWFEQEVLIEGPGLLFELERDPSPIDLDQLVVLDWTDVDITRESQGAHRDPATVQARAATRLIGLRDWDVVLDDDGTGEIADLVALKAHADRLILHLVHCKFSSESVPGARVQDQYEVCGQAHRSAHHRQHLSETIKNLIRRERKRRQRGASGLLVGGDDDLLAFEELVRVRRPELHVTVVQPGLSKAAAQTRHVQLLGAADVYVKEIAHAAFEVWCSA